MAESVKKASSTGKKTATSTEVKKTVRKSTAKTSTATESTVKPSSVKKLASEPVPKTAIRKIAATEKSAASARKSSSKAGLVNPSKKVALPVISPEQRYQMIATAAYFIAEQRGFATGNELHDWYTAEKQINTQLGVC